MSGDVEVLYAIRDQIRDQKLKPKTSLGYNAAGDMVEILKDINGAPYTRLIDDPDVSDKVAVKWIEYGTWTTP